MYPRDFGSILINRDWDDDVLAAFAGVYVSLNYRSD